MLSKTIVTMLAAAAMCCCATLTASVVFSQTARATGTQASATQAGHAKVSPGAASKPASTTTSKATSKSASSSGVRRASADDTVQAWAPPAIPETLPGSIFPAKRIVAFYGNPLSKRMGILGELDSAKMLAKLDSEVARWNKADAEHPVQPALHLIAVVASNQPGTSGKYRQRMDSAVIARVYRWAKSRNALLFLDVQVGTGTLHDELPRLVPWLENADVHLGIDPEFSMKGGDVPGTKIGSFDAADINYASALLADIVTRKKVPPKVFVVHRFTRDMLTGTRKIALDPRVQIVINMDGWGPPEHKRESYRRYVWKYPVEYTGFKFFYHNDIKKPGSLMMTPAEVLGLNPKPLYIQYQ